MKFVIIIKVERSPLYDRFTANFAWEVRELLKKDGDDSNLLERTGPTLAAGVNADNATARSAAEEAARQLASEAIYVYDTDKP